METRIDAGDREAALLHLAQLIEVARGEVNRLTELRNQVISDLHSAGFTQERLAAAASVSQPYVARILKSVAPADPRAWLGPVPISASTVPIGAIGAIGARLAAARSRKGLSKENLAAAAGVDTEVVIGAEAGRDIPVSAFAKIAVALGKAAWLEDFESLEPTPGERLNAIRSGNPLPRDEGRWYSGQLAAQ